jgi:hypothetical protein
MSKRNVEKQEQVISLLWDICGEAQKNDPKSHVATRTEDGTRMSLDVMGRYLRDVMAVFGYDVVEIQ